MLEFVYKLNDVLPMWPKNTKWELKKIAEETNTSLPHTIQFLSEGLGKELDIANHLSLDEATEALLFLSKKLKPQIEKHEEMLAKKMEIATKVYDRITTKTRLMQMEKNWYGAYRTLSYFAGKYEEDLPRELLLSSCNEILRIGIKAAVNLQEMTQWLEKSIAIALSYRSKEGIEEALDVIDAYSEHFLQEDSGKGIKILANILSVLEEPAARFELWEEYKKQVSALYPSNA